MSGQAATWYQELVLQFEDGASEVMFIERTRSGRHKPRPAASPAPWTRLEFHKCPGCPLPASAGYCPAALSLEETLLKLSRRTSIEQVTATAVDGENRRTTVTWPLQQVGAAFVQLAVFSSGCPVGSQFQPMVLDLRPFSTTRELARHLVSKSLLRHHGEAEASKRAIVSRLEPVREVFVHLFNRLEGTRESGRDAIPNSIVHMHAMTQNMALRVEEIVEEVLGEARCPPTPARTNRPGPSRGFWSRLLDLFS